MKYCFLMLISTLFFFSKSYAQKSLWDDPNVVFKNKEGKVLTKEEVKELNKGLVSMQTKKIDSIRTEIIIAPITQREIDSITQKFQEDLINKLVNKPLPEFNFKDINNNSFQLTNLKGKIIVLNFWFVQCPQCVAEIPQLNKIVKAYPDVVFIAPALDEKEKIVNFLKTHSFKYNIIPAQSKYIESLGINAFPMHLIVDKKGYVRDVILADNELIIEDILKASIEKIK